MLSSSIAETNEKVSDKVIEYRRFILKGKIDEKREILNLLANEIDEIKKNIKYFENLFVNTRQIIKNILY